jgi:hypothetical protein
MAQSKRGKGGRRKKATQKSGISRGPAGPPVKRMRERRETPEREQSDRFRRWVLEAVVTGRVLRELLSESAMLPSRSVPLP